MHVSAYLATVCLSVELALGQSFVNVMAEPQPTYKPQTTAEGDRALAVGRYPGQLELLQPSLDPGLKSYELSSDGLSGNYTFAASDVLAVVSQRWCEAFMSMYPNVTIRVPAPYAGSLGAIELIKGNIQGVFVSRELKPSDISTFNDSFGYPPFSVPITGGSYRQFGFLDALAFVVNEENPIQSLSFNQLDSILSSTRARGGQPIRTWGQLGVQGSLANQTINIYGITPWNGFEEFIRQRVLSYNGTRGDWRAGNVTGSYTQKDPNVSWDSTVFNMSQHVFDDPAGLAYTGLAYVNKAVKLLALQNNTSDAPVAPTYENIALAKWPLSRVTYFNSNRSPTKGQDPVLKELTKFVLSKQGQQILLDQGIYLPFRAQQQQQSLDMLN